jgi:hypothetical protein
LAPPRTASMCWTQQIAWNDVVGINTAVNVERVLVTSSDIACSGGMKDIARKNVADT